MSPLLGIDVYSQRVMVNIYAAVFNSFNRLQIRAVELVISGNTRFWRYPVSHG